MRIFSTVFLILLFSCIRAQNTEPMDTVFLMSGKVVAGVVKDTSNEKLKILIPQKNNTFKADFVEQDLVFSVKYRNGQESVFYKQDTLFGNYYTPMEMRYYLQGERDARRSYHCPGWIAGAFAVGLASGYTQHFLMFVPPFAYSGISVGFRVKIKPGSISNPDYLRYDTYLMGYEKVARQKRIMRTLAAGGSGLVLGILTRSVVLSIQNQN